MSCKNPCDPCRLSHPSCIHILRRSLERSVKPQTWTTGSAFSTNESANGHGLLVLCKKWLLGYAKTKWPWKVMPCRNPCRFNDHLASTSGTYIFLLNCTHVHPCPPMLFKLRSCIQELCNVCYPPTPSLGWIVQIKDRSLLPAIVQKPMPAHYNMEPMPTHAQ